MNKLLGKSVIWKTKHKWNHKFAMEKNPNNNEILGTSYDVIISELKQHISLENEKYELQDKLSSYMEGLIKTKENGHYKDTVKCSS